VAQVRSRVFAIVLAATLSVAAYAPAAFAQAPGPATSSPPSAMSAPSGQRPATPTVNGDTGLWFLPTGDVLPARRWSFGASRESVSFAQGFTEVSNWPITAAIGLRGRAELFGALIVVNRIDRDVRPLFFPTTSGSPAGGVINEYPFVATGWTGNNLGDLWIGAKLNLSAHSTTAFAVRGMLKIPTADQRTGAGTGRLDFAVDGIVSREFNGRVEVCGVAGVVLRGDPSEYDLADGVRWGLGAGFPTRRHLRLTAEVHGEALRSDSVRLTGATFPAIDGNLIPSSSEQKSPAYATVGLTWLGRRFFAGAGVNFSLQVKGRRDSGSFGDRTGDAIGFLVRAGYHRGTLE
jgi:hypothetical protein